MIYIKGYFRFNLGDDLFLKILADRYSKTNFLAITQTEYKKENYKNVKLVNRKILNKLVRIITLNNNTYENYLMKKQDFTVLIGGSMFMENSYNKKSKYFIGGGKPYYILGSNFGPCKTQEFYDKFYDVFSKAEDVCFREEYSYNLFKNLPNVRYASDIVFSLDTSKIKITNNKNVIISVIDSDRKVKNGTKDEYENKIIEMIQLFDKKGYEITLMSFCEAEGDEQAIKSILSKVSDQELKNKLKSYFYKGNIDEALEVMGDCQIVVGTRFHANILGLVLGKTVIPIAYSDKTLNVLKDMNFNGKVFDIRDMENFKIDGYITDDDLNYKLDVSLQKKDALRHFEKLDQVIKKGEINE